MKTEIKIKYPCIHNRMLTFKKNTKFWKGIEKIRNFGHSSCKWTLV